MANHKSALKRNKQSLVRRERNRANKTKIKTVTKEILAAIDQADSPEKAQEALKNAIPVIYKAATKGSIHKRTASRRVSRLTKRVNNFVKGVASAA